MIRFQAAAAVVTWDTDIDTSLRDRLVRTRKSNKVERGGKTASTSFNSQRLKKIGSPPGFHRTWDSECHFSFSFSAYSVCLAEGMS